MLYNILINKKLQSIYYLAEVVPNTIGISDYIRFNLILLVYFLYITS